MVQRGHVRPGLQMPCFSYLQQLRGSQDATGRSQRGSQRGGRNGGRNGGRVGDRTAVFKEPTNYEEIIALRAASRSTVPTLGFTPLSVSRRVYAMPHCAARRAIDRCTGDCSARMIIDACRTTCTLVPNHVCEPVLLVCALSPCTGIF